MRRVGRFLEQELGQNPRQIIVVTFTRTAAHDLVIQLREINIPSCDNVRASTLHSYCFSNLSRREILNFKGRIPRPLLKYEENILLQDLPNRFGSIRELRNRLRTFEADWVFSNLTSLAGHLIQHIEISLESSYMFLHFFLKQY